MVPPRSPRGTGLTALILGTSAALLLLVGPCTILHGFGCLLLGWKFLATLPPTLSLSCQVMSAEAETRYVGHQKLVSVDSQREENR